MTDPSVQQVIAELESVFPCSCDRGARRKHFTDCAHYWIEDLIGELDARGYRLLLLSEPVEPAWVWVSFATDEGFRGVVVTRDPGNAVALASSLSAHGLNPGGEMAYWPLQLQHLPTPAYRDRLLTKEEVAALWPRNA